MALHVKYLSSLSLDEALVLFKPLVIFIAGMAVYAFFIFKFYKFLAKRDIFSLTFSYYDDSSLAWLKNFMKAIFYVVKYILIFPVIIFIWFAFLSLLLMYLSKAQDIQAVLLSSMALVAVVRIAAYYSEELSKDLAKMLPFALLGIFIIDASFFSLEQSSKLIFQIPTVWKTILYYLLFAIALEFVLRILYGIYTLLGGASTRSKMRR